MSMCPLILICDDDPVVHESLGIYLKSEGFESASAFDGQQALEMSESLHPDLIVLDLMMPKMSGTDVCRTIRQTSNKPIIMLTAKSEDTDKVLGLSIGADDYVTKPFNPMEVIARVRSQLRRYTMLGGMSGIEKKPSVISIDGVEIDDDAKTVTLDGEPVNLTPIEYSILKLLMENAGKVFSSTRIYELVWNCLLYTSPSPRDA